MWWFTKNKTAAVNPYELNWGIITVDGEKEKQCIHVFNSSMSNPEAANKTKSLIVNKYRYYQKQLPPDHTQLFVLDLRGQGIPDKQSEQIKADLLKEIYKIHPESTCIVEIKK